MCMLHSTIASRRRSGSKPAFCGKTHSLWATFELYNWGVSSPAPLPLRSAKGLGFHDFVNERFSPSGLKSLVGTDTCGNGFKKLETRTLARGLAKTGPKGRLNGYCTGVCGMPMVGTLCVHGSD